VIGEQQVLMIPGVIVAGSEHMGQEHQQNLFFLWQTVQICINTMEP
jgi:hypothetical protein